MSLHSAADRTWVEPSGAFGRATPMEAVDILLWALVDLSGALTIAPDPEVGTHTIHHERAGVSSPIATVPSSFGDALAARLAIVAGMPVGLPGTQLGRIRVRALLSESGEVDLLVAVRATPAGLEAEIHRTASIAPPSDTDASPEGAAGGVARIGTYRITGVLGHGGMGVVYQGEHLVLQKRVALKLLRAEVARDRKLAAQFLVEARAACRARHPGIVDVTDFGTLADGRSYLVMELVEWPTLARVLAAEGGPLPLARALKIVRNVGEALGAAAVHGVVHGDLTPSNIFVGPRDATKIGDFGLARIAESDPTRRSQTGVTGGTAGYMSPEQWLSEPTDSRSDIYSLAIILFRLLTGTMPFPASDPLELLHLQQSDAVPEAIGVDGRVPRELQALLRRALSGRPADRYQSFDEFLFALRDVVRAQARNGWTRWLE